MAIRTSNAIERETVKISYGLAAVGATLALAAVPGRAQLQFEADKLYLEVNAGVAIPQSTHIQASPLGNGGDVKFDTGLRAGLTVGYDIVRPVAVELETGVIWTPVQSIHDNQLSSVAAKADLYQIPMLVNVLYKPLDGAFRPYLGVGAGGAASIFDSSNIPLFGNSFNDQDFAFAYQGEAGFRYAVCRYCELGVAYKVMGTSDHHWTDHGASFNTDGNLTHSIVATFMWRF